MEKVKKLGEKLINSTFEQRAAQIYGERWPALLEALQKPKVSVALFSEPQKSIDFDSKFSPLHIARKSDSKSAYHLDPASLLPVFALQPEPNQDILDLCAAPGGKALAITSFVKGDARITLNEISRNRRERLKRNLNEFLPKNWIKSLRLTGKEASRWGMFEPNAYDRILVDVPCSGERHLLQSEGEMEKWTPARSKNLRVRQFAILASAFDALKSGGKLVYSTCSLEPKENDGIVERLFQKREGVLSLKEEAGSATQIFAEELEETNQGHIALPDQNGTGPIYFSLIGKD